MISNYSYIIPILSLLGLIYLFLRYINLFFRINKLEDEFSSIVNHTFRTPITRILWTIKELEKDLTKIERENYLNSITVSTNRILSVVDIVTGIKKIDDISGYNFEAVSIREIIEESISKYSDKIKEKNLIFQISSFNNIPMLSLDLKKISFVFDNLINNSISYTQKNGTILIYSTFNIHNLTFYIKDNGLGLSFIDKLRIFSKFYRNKKAITMNTEGMGLGLYLSKKIVKRHKGSISAKSKGRNKGSTFSLVLPFKR